MSSRQRTILQLDFDGTLVEGDASIKLAPLNRINEIVQELKSGRINAAIIEDTVAAGFLANNPDLKAIEIPDEEEAGSAIAFPKGSDKVEDFNRVLAEMQTSGLMEELILKWFGDGEE